MSLKLKLRIIMVPGVFLTVKIVSILSIDYDFSFLIAVGFYFLVIDRIIKQRIIPNCCNKCFSEKNKSKSHKFPVSIFIQSNVVCPDDKAFERLIYCTESASAQILVKNARRGFCLSAKLIFVVSNLIPFKLYSILSKFDNASDPQGDG